MPGRVQKVFPKHPAFASAGESQPTNPGNMSRHIYQKESILVSVGSWSAGAAVSAGVSPIYNIHQAHHLNRPVMQQHPGRARATHFCMELRHYKILHSVPAPVFSPSAPRYKLKFGVVPNVGFSRHIRSRGALFSPATFPSGVFIATRIKLVIPSCKDTAGRASRLIRRNSVTAAPRQSVSACESAGPLFSRQIRISPKNS